MESSRYADHQPEPAPPATSSPLEPETSSIPAFEVAGTDEDAFAQTRQAEDLFFDDFTPVEETIVIPARPAETTEPRNENSREAHGQNERRGGRGRGIRPRPSNIEPKPEGETEGSNQPGKDKPKESGAVRGDRSGTGGVRKPKLTEDELSARLESIKLKNKELEEAHRRAEADEASFRQREKLAQAKVREERQNRQALEGERERNRQRKLKALQGREWDAEKNEEDYNQDRSRGSQFRRGAYGGVAYDGARPGYGANDGQYDGDSYAPRGGRDRGNFRGGRGRGGGRGGGGHRESSAPNHSEKQQQPQKPPTADDFPALPGGSSEKIAEEKTSDKDNVSSQAPETAPSSIQMPESTDAKGTWAEQVEAGMPITPAAT
ncbi:hypothetical protein L228DRAFT_248822 [Xylona heveae TC161]|uniref:CAP-Gly domain-containing protein n=1 Tax=Xylona heveae (strain CBS 132557 / TC161) TaxID=1328760 RepID=A0A165FJU3_XYLHT|nr:hypothetical protein L228DRAFT_248822 [Xylona heveae TC161]KZF21060.1 hypothetical protein L228DRAFT_248822 [Xylona heveae TC161]